MDKNEQIESWLRHLLNALEEAEWETAGECYIVKRLLVPFEVIEEIKKSLDGRVVPTM